MSLVPAFEIGAWNAWILTLGIAVLPRCLTRLINKDAYKNRETPSDMKLNKTEMTIGVSAWAIVHLALIYSIFLPLQLGTIWFYVGLAVSVLALIMFSTASTNFLTAPLDEPVTKGMYRYSRHPGYLAVLLVFLGVGIAATSWLYMFLSLILAVLIHFIAVIEERSCLDKYGDAYREYMNRTPRWIGVPKR